MLRVATVGVYGFGGKSFLQRLRHADVRLLLDVRQRRGVRGPEYAWANSHRLQAALAHARSAYEHHPELAPLRADGSAASGASPLGFNVTFYFTGEYPPGSGVVLLPERPAASQQGADIPARSSAPATALAAE